MTRPGWYAAALSLNFLKGHPFGLQFCCCAGRHLVSPRTTMRASEFFGIGSGTGSGPPKIDADFVPGGITFSQTVTGNPALGCARTSIDGWSTPKSILGQLAVPSKTARATAPCGPITTYAADRLFCAAASGAAIPEQMNRNAAQRVRRSS